MLADHTSTFRASLIANIYQKWLSPGFNVLDIGCGNGVVSEFLANKFKLKLTGCDIVNYLEKKINFIKIPSKSSLPEVKTRYDAIMFNDVLHHTSYTTQEKLLEDAIKKGKKVLIFEVQPTLLGTISDWVINKIHFSSMNIPLTFRKTGEWQKIFVSLGCKYQTVKVRRPFLYPFNHVAFLLTPKRR